LQHEIGNYDRAVELYKQAITLFQGTANLGAEMQASNNLGVAEINRGNLDAAEAWYARSRELAERLNDRRQLAAIAQNVGILYQTRAEGAPDPETRNALLRLAVASVEESLAIKLEMQSTVATALSYGQLGILHWQLGALDVAEENARQALQIHESLNLPDVYKDYNTLAHIARDRGDTDAATAWEAKRDAKRAELERLARGEGTEAQAGEVSAQFVQAVLALAQVAFAARTGNAALPPDATEVLAQLKELPSPFGSVGAFLQTVADGGAVPSVPAGLPSAVAEILEKLVEAVSETP
jgi:tetratricopeptide (TPR) repeat protein